MDEEPRPWGSRSAKTNNPYHCTRLLTSSTACLGAGFSSPARFPTYSNHSHGSRSFMASSLNQTPPSASCCSLRYRRLRTLALLGGQGRARYPLPRPQPTGGGGTVGVAAASAAAVASGVAAVPTGVISTSSASSAVVGGCPGCCCCCCCCCCWEIRARSRATWTDTPGSSVGRKDSRSARVRMCP